MSRSLRLRRVLPLALLALIAACDSADPKAARAVQERRGVEEAVAQVRAAPQVASNGRWDEVQLTQRLVNAGLAPRADDSIPSHPAFAVRPVGLRVGKAHLIAWVFRDSVARQKVSGTIDTLTAIPQGQQNVWAEPPMFVVHNNMIAVLVGGSDRQRERVRLAIEAGLPAPRR